MEKMMSKELIEEVESLLEEYGFDLEEAEEVEIIEEGDWVSEGKYEVCESILKYKEKLFCMVQSRSGSYYTDYYYNEPHFYEVIPKVISKTIYEAVK